MSLFAQDYDSVQVGGYKQLPAGGYICRILGAKAEVSRAGNPMVTVMLDIIDGEYTGFFMNKYRDKKANADDPTKVKYPNDGVSRIVTDDSEGHTKKAFKGFVTSVERSNDVMLPREDNAFVAALKDKEVGVLFGREEYMGTDGKRRWSTKPRFFRDVESIVNGDYTTPEDQCLKDPQEALNTAATALFGEMPQEFSATDENLPF